MAKEIVPYRSPRKKKSDRRGKWSRDPWIRILQLLNSMPAEERRRCIRATIIFWEGK